MDKNERKLGRKTRKLRLIKLLDAETELPLSLLDVEEILTSLFGLYDNFPEVCSRDKLNKEIKMIKVMVMVLCGLLSTTVFAAKPDWPTKDGMGIIGFGLVELEPGEKSKRFRFTYEIPTQYAGQLDSAQMIILPAEALEKYNNIPASALISRVSGKQHLPEKPISLSTEVTIDKPGLYVVAYGPWNGLLTFDNVKGTENYKISAEAVGDAQLKWIDQDAGDFTVVDLENVDSKKEAVFHMRLRIIRDNEL